MTTRYQAIKASTRMCADVLSIVKGYEWNPFEGIILDFTVKSNTRGHLVVGRYSDNNVIHEKIPVSVEDLKHSSLLNTTKRRKIMHNFMERKRECVPRMAGPAIENYMYTYLTDIMKEYTGLTAFRVCPGVCRPIIVSRPGFAAICSFILEEIKKKHPLFGR